MDINGLSGNNDGYAMGVFAVAIVAGAYSQLKKYDITFDKIMTKARMRYDIAKAIEPLDDDAVLQFLQILAPGPDGTIDVEEAKRVICDFVTYHNRVSKMLPMHQKK